MHRVIVVPLAAPDEAVSFKDLDDGCGDLVAVLVAPFAPSPVGRILHIDIDGSTKGVNREALSACDPAPFEGASSVL